MIQSDKNDYSTASITVRLQTNINSDKRVQTLDGRVHSVDSCIQCRFYIIYYNYLQTMYNSLLHAYCYTFANK